MTAGPYAKLVSEPSPRRFRYTSRLFSISAGLAINPFASRASRAAGERRTKKLGLVYDESGRGMISDETSSDSPLSSSGRPNARARSGQASTHIGSLPSDTRSEHPSHFELCLENGIDRRRVVRTRHGAVAAADAFLRIDANEVELVFMHGPRRTHMNAFGPLAMIARQGDVVRVHICMDESA